MIAFLTEGNNEIGMGHFLRCFGIAEKLSEQGERVSFIIPGDADRSFPESKGFDTHVLKSVPNASWNIDEACELLKRLKADTVVADSYRLSNEDFGGIRKVCRLIYLDDLDLFDCNVDAVINFNPEADEAKYLSAGIPNRKVFAGVKYYPLRKEFEGKRKPDISPEVKSVLITSGSTDPYECVLNILNGIGPDSHKGISFSILVGKYYSDEYVKSLNDLCMMHENVSLLPWGDRIADELVKADLLITPGSSMVMEGLSLNVPCITYEFVDNQHETVVWLDKLGMAASFGRLSDGNPGSAIRKVFESELPYEVRARRSKVYSEVFDGKGLDRVVDIIRKRSF